MPAPTRNFQGKIRASHKKAVAFELSGSAQNVIVMVLMVMFVAGGGYLFSVNQTAVQGYHLRALEKEIDTLKEKNSELRIAEADLRSLYKIEASKDELQMEKVDTNVKFLEARDTVALK
ncbi:MAG: hypothetical protein AAB519_01290 [Patescibacteria group bacterium]